MPEEGSNPRSAPTDDDPSSSSSASPLNKFWLKMRETSSIVWQKTCKTVCGLKLDMEQNPLKYWFVLPVALFFAAFLIIPVASVFIAAFQDDQGGFTLKWWKDVFSDSKFFDWGGEGYTFKTAHIEATDEKWILIQGVSRGVVLNTLMVALFTTILALILGVSLAFFMAKRDFRGKSIVSIMLLIPLIIPPFIGGMGFLTMFGETGLVNEQILVPLFKTRIIISGIFAMVFVEAFHYYTLIYLNVYSSLINVDPSLEEQAKSMGAKGWTLTRTITLPLALPGIAAGSILTFILSMEDLGTPLVFADRADPVAKQMMTYYMFANLENRDPNAVHVMPAYTAVIGTLLVFIAVIGFFAIRKYVSMRSYAMLTKGRAGEKKAPRAKKWEMGLFLSIYLIIFMLSIVTHLGVLYLAFSRIETGTFDFPPRWTLDNFRFVFSAAHDVRPFIMNTILYSGLALVIILIFGTMAAYALARIDFKGRNWFDALITIPIALPGVVIGIGYFQTFTGTFAIDILKYTGIKWLIGLWGGSSDFVLTFDPFVYPVLLLICSYAIRKFPFAVRSIFAGLQQTTVEFEEVSMNLGASRMRTLGSITLPLISLNMVAGGLVALVYTISEVSTTLVLIDNAKYGTITWTMGTQQTAHFGVFAALGVLLMTIQIISLVVTNFLLRNRAEAMTGI